MIKFTKGYSWLWYASSNLPMLRLCEYGNTKEEALNSLIVTLPKYIELLQQSLDEARQVLHEHSLGRNAIV